MAGFSQWVLASVEQHWEDNYGRSFIADPTYTVPPLEQPAVYDTCNGGQNPETSPGRLAALLWDLADEDPNPSASEPDEITIAGIVLLDIFKQFSPETPAEFVDALIQQAGIVNRDALRTVVEEAGFTWTEPQP